MFSPAAFLFSLLAIFGVPVVIARFAIGGGWLQLGTAYGIWFGLVFLAFASSGNVRWSDRIGWMIVAAIALTIVAVPVLTLLLRLFGWLHAGLA